MNSTYKAAGLVTALALLSGCSVFKGGETDFRDSEGRLMQGLELPPNFVSPGQERAQLNRHLSAPVLQENDTLPRVSATGVSVESNLVQRWLVFEDKTSFEVYNLLQRFVAGQGFEIAMANFDLGLVQTDYLARTDIAPVALEVSLLTRLLNRWREERVTGLYDRYSFQITEQDGQVAVFVQHNMMTADSSGDITQWRLRSYDPMMEMLALHRFLVFAGDTSESAVEKIAQAPYYHEVLHGEEIRGIALAAPIEQAWDYLQAQAVRADWNIVSQSRSERIILVEVNEDTSSLNWLNRIFAGQRSRVLVLMLAEDSERDGVTLVQLNAQASDTPINGEQRRAYLEQLGLLFD
ncbi:outer membrane protein assembly factor BamC [Thiomicrospira sp. ALE5]|uniref:outer membrane protein assembly factor BamC n=1 Tax=Thiomicrospira sp. ALE5 TaxID=748650 RepID=UPI0008DFB6CD|nr:outer membrane protein assembly factor BamC [Thiomicrospira sp. ALE5]SFR49712.1 Beta-barrel assembly machine subunit BamC [Thiomicrospira sp. ALE5]